MRRPSLLWFRQDFRLADNPALAAAVAAGPVVPVYILDDETPGAWKAGGASRWWLHKSLEALAADLRRRGADLVLRRGDAAEIIPALVEETNAAAVFWNRVYEPFAIARDKKIKAALEENGIRAQSFNASLLIEPWTIATGGDTPFRVFTPFWKAASAKVEAVKPTPAPTKIVAPERMPKSERLNTWELLPAKPNWARGFTAAWTPGEMGAHDRLMEFLDGVLANYATARDRPDLLGTSRLSAHLHWGEIGPRQIWWAIETLLERKDARTLDTTAAKFRSELGWREFSTHLLYHFPHITERNFRPTFDSFPWVTNASHLKAWQQGATGYPIVDAGMRELWLTGYMHNRVRMIAASFLIKHLLIDWRQGAKWFWDTLVDADLANNSASWQWVAGSGADAAPYFRIFNPVLQGEKHDPDGTYVRKWVPELADCDARFVHRPWAASNFPSLSYHSPIVDHDRARARALEAFASISTDA